MSKLRFFAFNKKDDPILPAPITPTLNSLLLLIELIFFSCHYEELKELFNKLKL